MAKRADAKQWLAKISVPSMVIAGERDVIIPVGKAYEMAAMMKNSKLVILKGSCHMPMLEEPEETAKAIEQLVSLASK